MLIGFILYGFVYPIYTRLGCTCLGEKCRPSKEEMAETDHIIDEPENLISDAIVDAVVQRMNTFQIQASLASHQMHSPMRRGKTPTSQAGRVDSLLE